MQIFHNPRCSKSRETLDLIKAQGIEPEIIEYLKTPPTAAELKDLLQKLQLRPRDIVRTKEERFEALNLDLNDDRAVLAALETYPELIERPIVVAGKSAVIARPPEKVKELF